MLAELDSLLANPDGIVTVGVEIGVDLTVFLPVLCGPLTATFLLFWREDVDPRFRFLEV